MVARQRVDLMTRTRVYKYGAVPIGTFPEAGIQELYRSNQLWNKFVELHNDQRKNYERARCVASDEYALISQSIELKEQEIEEAYKAKRMARALACTKDATHPLIDKAVKKIDALKKERSKLWEQAKPLREAADKGLNKKELTDAFNVALNKSKGVKQSGIASQLADHVLDAFKTARDRAFKDNTRLNFHKFDGTGLFFYRLRRAESSTDGVSFRELFNEDPNGGGSLVFQALDESRRKPRLRLRAKVAGGAKKDSKVYAFFDVILHRPLPPQSQIQNVRLNRTRVGDRFEYSVCLTVKEEMPEVPSLFAGAIGVDIGFRQTDQGRIRAAAICQVDVQGQGIGSVKFVDVSNSFVGRLGDNGHINALKTQLDESAATLGRQIKPLLKAGSVVQPDHKKYKMVHKVANLPEQLTLSFELAYKMSTGTVSISVCEAVG
jgi:hypothetical protein